MNLICTHNDKHYFIVSSNNCLAFKGTETRKYTKIPGNMHDTLIYKTTNNNTTKDKASISDFTLSNYARINHLLHKVTDHQICIS